MSTPRHPKVVAQDLVALLLSEDDLPGCGCPEARLCSHIKGASGYDSMLLLEAQALAEEFQEAELFWARHGFPPPEAGLGPPPPQAPAQVPVISRDESRDRKAVEAIWRAIKSFS